MSFYLKDYHYSLPDDLIAIKPSEPRDHARLLLVERTTQNLQHYHVKDFVDLIPAASVLVVNNTKVIPARLTGQRHTGGQIEVLLLKELESNLWLCKIKNSRRISINEKLDLCDNQIHAILKGKNQAEGLCTIEFQVPQNHLFSLLEQYAYAPLPPYIQKNKSRNIPRHDDLLNYQTIFAHQYGAIAAPTAGLHFTPELLMKIKNKGVQIVEITLHVGLGTFNPIQTSDIRDHQIHTEQASISEEVAAIINQAKLDHQKIIAVGTTSVRTLEAFWENHQLLSGTRDVNLFIYPPYHFQVVDHILTNFHLPQSSLLLLVAAFTGRELILDAYRQAIIEKYRFYSYGDAMLIR